MMNATERITKGRLIAFICLLLLPLVMIALGIILLLADTLINLTFSILFIILPLGFAALLALILFSTKLKTTFKVLLTVLLSAFLVFAFLWGTVIGMFESLCQYNKNELAEPYAEAMEEIKSLPALTEIGNTENVTYYDYFSTLGLGFFTCDADYLICQYSENEYQKQVEAVNETYVFHSEKLSASGHSIEPVAEIDGYTFRLLEDIAYPKQLIFIATNDETHEIIYMYFCDDDLDYITSLTDFILDDCGFKHIQ